MKTVVPSPLLKLALLADAVASAAIAALQLAAPGWLAAELELPRTLLIQTGVFLVGYVALLLLLAFSARVWSAAVWLVILGNFGWAVSCIAVLAAGAIVPNAIGAGFLVLQALAVVLFANFQLVGLKGSAIARSADALSG